MNRINMEEKQPMVWQTEVVKKKPVLDSATFRAIMTAHKCWVMTDGKDGERAVLGQYDLQNIDFAGLSLSYVDFRGADLRGKNFSGATLSHADFSEVDAQETNFSFATLRGAKLFCANFSYTNMIHSNLLGAFCNGTNFSYAKFDAPNFFFANMTSANLVGVNAVNASFANAILVETDMSGGKYLSCNFTDCDGKNTNLSHSNCNEAIFVGSNLYGSDLSESTFCNANLQRADIRKTNQHNTLMFNTQLQQVKTDEQIMLLALLDKQIESSLVYNVTRDQISFLPDTKRKTPVTLQTFQAYCKDEPKYAFVAHALNSIAKTCRWKNHTH